MEDNRPYSQMADAREKLALGIKTRRFRMKKKSFSIASASSQRDYSADKLFDSKFFRSERESSSVSWFVSCSNLKCKVDTHGNKSQKLVRIFVSEEFNLRAQ